MTRANGYTLTKCRSVRRTTGGGQSALGHEVPNSIPMSRAIAGSRPVKLAPPRIAAITFPRATEAWEGDGDAQRFRWRRPDCRESSRRRSNGSNICGHRVPVETTRARGGFRGPSWHIAIGRFAPNVAHSGPPWPNWRQRTPREKLDSAGTDGIGRARFTARTLQSDSNNGSEGAYRPGWRRLAGGGRHRHHFHQTHVARGQVQLVLPSAQFSMWRPTHETCISDLLPSALE